MIIAKFRFPAVSCRLLVKQYIPTLFTVQKNALRFFRSKLLLQVLFLLLFKGLLLQTNREEFGVVDLHLSKELATIRAPNNILKHPSIHSHNGSDHCLLRLVAIRAMKLFQYSSTAMLLILHATLEDRFYWAHL